MAGLAITVELVAQNVEMRSDSNMIVGHVSSEYVANKKRMQKYPTKVRELMAKLKQFVIKKVPQAQNSVADQLACLTMALKEELDSSQEQVLLVLKSSIAPAKEVVQVEARLDWVESIVLFLEEGILLQDRREAKKLRMKAARYTFIHGILYK